MANNNNKIWSKEEMIENADNWSLAGDVALLNSIKAFSNRLLDQTVLISGNVDNLLNNLNDVSLKLDLTKNKFQSLRNTQFIESRVYEDDETLDSKDESGTKIEDVPPSEEEKDRVLKESIKRGLEVMNKYYDKVEDADESYVLPKDMYVDRPLPFLIGSEEWYKKWHVGLLQSSSESESEKEVEDAYSDSDSEDYLPKDILMGSETSSELSLSNTQNSNGGPPANSTFNDSVIQRKRDDFPSSDSTSSDYTNSFPHTRAPISNQQFANELAQKLGTVVNNQENNTIHVNKNPIRTATDTNKFMGGLFSDEPPPLDDFSDNNSSKNANSGLFSGGTDLFGKEEDEDELFWNQQTKIAENKKSVQEGVQTSKEHQNEPIKNLNVSKPSELSKGLFDSASSSSSEEDIFSTYKKQQPAKPFLQPFSTTTVPIFDDKPPELKLPRDVRDNLPPKKKPVGGVSIFGDVDIAAKQIIKPFNSGDYSNQNSLLDKTKDVKNQESQDLVSKISAVKPSDKKITSLFDDSDNEDDFEASLLDKKKQSLFDSPEITSKDFERPVKNKTLNLFEDIDNDGSTLPEAISTVQDKIGKTVEESKIIKPENSQKLTTTTKKISLFDDNDDLFKSDYDDIFSIDKNITKRFTSSLFDDLDDQSGDSDIFGIKKGDPTKSDIDDLKSSSDKKVIENVIKSNESLDKKKINMFESSGFDGESFLESDIFGAKKVKEQASLNTNNQKSGSNDSDLVNKKSQSDIFNESEDGKISNRTENPTKRLEPKNEECSSTKFEEENKYSKEDKTNLAEDSDMSETFNTEKPEHLAEDSLKEDLKTNNKGSSLTDHGKGDLIRDEMIESNNDIEKTKQPDIKVTEATPLSDESLEKKPRVSRPLNLFDPTPPPDDNWDTKSDISDLEDQFSYNEDVGNPQGFSIFDNEPPLLHRNDDTSGIVVDQNVTRVESDDSSFYPFASSSRRFSSDIFSDQQSNDNLFVTKNKTESLPAGNLQSIPETTRIIEDTRSNTGDKYVDITPSGDAVDFLDDTTSFNSSVFESKKDTPKSDNIEQESRLTRKKISLFDSDQEDTDNYDDMFSTEKITHNGKSQDVVGSGDKTKDGKYKSTNVQDNQGAGDGSKQKKGEENIENSPPLQNSGSTSKVANLAEKLQSSNRENENKEVKTTSSPGKLKHNLNINVNALMPGLGPPKLRNTEKSHSLDSGKDSNEAEVTSTSSSDSNLHSNPGSNLRASSQNQQEKPVAFDNGSGVEVLQSFTKDRVKIPIKRRPSTRKARQESLKKSNLMYENADNESQITAIESTTQKPESFDVKPEATETKPVKAEEQEIKQQKLTSEKINTQNKSEKMDTAKQLLDHVKTRQTATQDKLNISSDDEADLFAASSVKQQKTTAPKQMPKTKPSLFSDSPDSDDDLLFGGRKKDDTIVLPSSGDKKEVKRKSKSLFGDDGSSDDDLFQSGSGSREKKQKGLVTRPIERKPFKTSTVKKLQNTEADDDPLSSILK